MMFILLHNSTIFLNIIKCLRLFTSLRLMFRIDPYFVSITSFLLLFARKSQTFCNLIMLLLLTLIYTPPSHLSLSQSPHFTLIQRTTPYTIFLSFFLSIFLFLFSYFMFTLPYLTTCIFSSF